MGYQFAGVSGTHEAERLTTQYERVWEIMRDGHWRALWDIAIHTQHRFHKRDSEAAISARLRDFRKERNGAHTVERRRRQVGNGWEYRVIVNDVSHGA